MVPEAVSSPQPKTEIYQCNNCLTRYDKVYGDYVNNIDKQVDFTELANYQCPVCEAPKDEFSLIEAPI